jgi:hypothetical protein
MPGAYQPPADRSSGAGGAGRLVTLARQLVLTRYAAERGLEPAEDEVDAAIAEVRAAQADERGFAEYLERAGFADEADFRAVVERSLTMQQVIATLRADIVVPDEEIEAWYEANPDLVVTPEGPLPLDTIRNEIEAVLAQERLEERVDAIVAAAPLQVFAERL